MESVNTTPDEDHCCACKKTQSQLSNPLKHCAKCKTQQYCSRECQKADWKAHKKACGSSTGTDNNTNQNGSSSGSGGSTSSDSTNPLAAIAEKRFFDSKPETKAFAQIIDSYRLRVQDEYTFMSRLRGIYNQEHPRQDFKRYLDKAEIRGVLPKWWNAEKRRACEGYGFNESNWSYLKSAVEKSDIIKHYGNNMMPMHLRMVAEEVEDSNVMGQPVGAGLRTMLARSMQGGMMHHFDISDMFRR